jgi:hypothetical protein
MGDKTVIIEWEKVDNWKEVEKLNRDEDYGIYQITGHHPIFGNNSLLYIGKAEDQTFGKRIEQHKNWLQKEWDVTIYIGRTTNIENDIWNTIINDVEPLLIYFHSPPYNSQHVSEAPNPKTKLRIINTGDCGVLYPEISHIGLEKYDKHRPKSEITGD